MIQEFNNICQFRSVNPGIKGSGISVNDPKLRPVIRDLNAIKDFLRIKFENYNGLHFEIEISRGQAYFPSILHVCILPPKQLVSKGIYVAICFDIRGRGALVGCLESVTNPQGLNTKIRKKRRNELNIDVDGLRSTTKYNNAFENPKEFLNGLQTDEELLQHIKESIDLSLYHLGLANSAGLTIMKIVEAEIESPEFNPTDLTDGRLRIARMIAARRGQRKFRGKLLKAYFNKCAVTGCDVESVLEAAHILPYKGDQTNHVQNGILLRSDLHLLFDLGLLTIEAETYKLKIHKELWHTSYFQFHGKIVNLPERSSDYPYKDALKYHNEKEFKK